MLVMSMLVFVLYSWGQSRKVTGTVTDGNGSPLPNATVMIKGTRTGTTTGSDGQYSLSVSPSSRILVFSAIGMEEVEYTVGNKAVIDASLKASDKNMQEIVVVGYGTQKRKDLTGSTVTIKGSAIAEKPVQSFESALSGRAAGVQITVPNGVLNSAPVFRIRGTNSISLSSYPLIVIDGVATFTGDLSGTSASANPLASINPADIESIDIAKDAAAASIYGSRAANGVVYVTTKKGKQGRARVTYDGWAGWTTVQRLPRLLNAQQYTDLKNEGLRNSNTYNAATNFFALTNGPDGKPIDTRWYDFIYRQGFSHSNTVNVSGANEATNYYFSVGYTGQEGIIRKNDFNRKSVLFNIDHKVGKIISLGAKISYSNEENLAAASSGSLPGEAFSTSGLGRLAVLTAPNVSPYNNDGSYNVSGANIGVMGNKVGQVGFNNPVVSLDLNRSNSEVNHIQSNAYVQVKPLSWLALRSVFGIDYVNVENESYSSPLSGEGYSTTGSATSSFNKNKRWVWTNTASLDYVFGEKHSIGLLLGEEEQRSTSNGFGLNRQTVSDPFYTNIQGGWATPNTSGLSIGENYLFSLFSRVQYDYEKKYFLSANVRQDEYSGLGTSNKKGLFYGASAGWEITKEKFWENLALDKVFSSFKLRGSYGKVGNVSGIGNFESYTTYAAGLYGGNATLNYSVSGNPELKWETSKKTDVGINLGFFNEKLVAELAWYKNNIDGLILDVPQPPSAGVPNAIRQNVGSMYNQGIEVTLTSTPVSTKTFSWTTSLNFSTNKNEVTALAPGLKSILSSTSGLESVSLTLPGYSLGTINVVRTAGVDPATGRRIFLNAAGQQIFYQQVVPAGQYNWSYADGTEAKGRITLNDAVPYRNTNPRYYGGFDNTFRLGRFELNALLTYQGGFYIYYGSNAGLRDQRFWNSSTDMLRRWQKPGDITDIPRIFNGDNVSNGSANAIDVNVFKGDFVKLRNLSLNYSIPTKIIERAKISSIRAYVSGQNLYIHTKYPGPDPEVSANGNGAANQGVDRNGVANARTITVGLNVGF
jgi:TonB-linked SusC/RagA family outer membrane protein